MPLVLLTRSVIADIKNQRSDDCLEIAEIDPNEQNIPKLTRLLGQALQVTMTLQVLELTQPSPELINLVAYALTRPRCRLQGLKLKGLKKTELAEITKALSYFSSEHITMTMAGIVGTSCHTLIITLAAQPFTVMQLTSLQISQLATHGLPLLTPAPIESASELVLLPAWPMPKRSSVADHSLSASSRWGHGDSLSLKERFRSEIPLVSQGLAIDEKVTSSEHCAVWNTPLNPLLPASQTSLAPQVSATSHTVKANFCVPPVSALTGVAAMGTSITGQLPIHAVSTAEHTPKHPS